MSVNTDSFPICVQCKHVVIQYQGRKPGPNNMIDIACSKVTSSHCILTGYKVRTNGEPDVFRAEVSRMNEQLCGLQGRWFEPKA